MTFAQCKPAQEELNVVSFNIRMGVAKDGENSWEYRKAASAEMVKTLAPDIMGVQEAFDFQTEYIKEQCPPVFVNEAPGFSPSVVDEVIDLLLLGIHPEQDRHRPARVGRYVVQAIHGLDHFADPGQSEG